MKSKVFVGASSVAFLLIAAGSFLSAGIAKKWTTYRSNILGLMVSVPSDWTPVKNKKALGFRYQDPSGGTAAVGFLKSSDRSSSIDAQAGREFKREGQRAGWVRSFSTIGGMRAIKMAGTSTITPNQRIIHYFVQTPSGVYLIQCQASSANWRMFSGVFNTILMRLKFLPKLAD